MVRHYSTVLLRSPEAGSRRALSALEMIVVLLIVVLLGTTAYFYYAQFQQRDVLEADAMRIQKMLGTARSQAVTDGETCQVGFDIVQETFWLEREVAPNQRQAIIAPAPMNDFVNVHEVDVSTGSAPPPSTPNADTRYIRFYPDGSSEDARIYLIRAEEGDPAAAPDEAFYTVKLYGPTAKPRIFDKERR